MTEKDIIQLVKKDTWMMEVLRTVRSLQFSDWMVGGGFIRSKVWDYLHGYKERTKLPDVDVTYFDKECASEFSDKTYEARLKKMMPAVPWSVGNAARLHLERGDPPYTSAAQSLEYWVETATATGLYLDDDDTLTLLMPYGIDDLVNLIVRPTPLFYKERMDLYRARQAKKRWKENWPKLEIFDL